MRTCNVFDIVFQLQRFDMNRWFVVTEDKSRKKMEMLLSDFSAARPGAKYRIRQERRFKEGYEIDDKTLGQIKHQAKQIKREQTAWKKKQQKA